MAFTVSSEQNRELYKKVVPTIDLTANADDIGRAWEFHQAQSRLGVALVESEISPDDFLDGLYDVMGGAIDPYLDEILIGLGRLADYG